MVYNSQLPLSSAGTIAVLSLIAEASTIKKDFLQSMVSTRYFALVFDLLGGKQLNVPCSNKKTRHHVIVYTTEYDLHACSGSFSNKNLQLLTVSVHLFEIQHLSVVGLPQFCFKR